MDCTVEPSYWQILLIIPLVLASGAFVLTASVSIISLVTTLIGLIMSGESIGVIGTIIAADFNIAVGSSEMLAGLVASIMAIFGC